MTSWLLILLTGFMWRPCVAEAPASVTPTPKERTANPQLQEKLNIALEQARKELHGKALETYHELIRSPKSTRRERWRWFVRTGTLHLLALESLQAERAFYKVLRPDEDSSKREVTVVVSGKAQVVKVPDPLAPAPPPGAMDGERGRHVRYEAAVGIARALAQRGEYERAEQTLEGADAMHPLNCPLCEPSARLIFAALSQTYEAAAQQTPIVDAAYNRLHYLINGRAWLPLETEMGPKEAQAMIAREARLVLGEMLLAIGDPAKAKTFLEQASKGQSVAAKLTRSHLRKLGDTKKRPSEWQPGGAPPLPNPVTPVPLPLTPAPPG